MIGAPAWSNIQFMDDVDQTDDLRLPADVTVTLTLTLTLTLT